MTGKPLLRAALLFSALAATSAAPGYGSPVVLTPGDILYSSFDSDPGIDQPHLFHIDWETNALTEIGPYATQVLAEGPTSVLLAAARPTAPES